MDTFVSAQSVLHRTGFPFGKYKAETVDRGVYKGRMVLEACIPASTVSVTTSSNILELSDAGSFIIIRVKMGKGKLRLQLFF